MKIILAMLFGLILSAFSTTLPDYFSTSLDSPLPSIRHYNLINIYDNDLPNEVMRISIFGTSVLNDTNAMDIKETQSTLVIWTSDFTELSEDTRKLNCMDSLLRSKTIYTSHPPTYVTPLYLKNDKFELYDFYLRSYSDSIHKWFNSRKNKFIRQINEIYYKPDYNWYYFSWRINIWNSAYLPDSVKFLKRDLLSTTGRRTVRSIGAMERVKGGKYAIKSGLLQPGDSVYVSIGISRSPRYSSVIKFIDLRDPDDNRHTVIESNDSVRVESWLNPKSRRLTTLAKKYGKIISKRLATMKERATRDGEEAYEFRYWTDLMIIPAKR